MSPAKKDNSKKGAEKTATEMPAVEKSTSAGEPKNKRGGEKTAAGAKVTAADKAPKADADLKRKKMGK